MSLEYELNSLSPFLYLLGENQYDTRISGWYSQLVGQNFGLSDDDLATIRQILGHKSRKQSPEEQEKIKQSLYLLDKYALENPLNNKDDIKKAFIDIRREIKYQPSYSKLATTLRTALWPIWSKPLNLVDPAILLNPLTNMQISSKLDEVLSVKDTKGSYGVVNFTVVTEPFGACVNNCYMCPNPPDIGPFKAPRSYEITEPAVSRGALVNFCLIEQIRTRTRDYAMNGHVRRVRDPVSGKWTTLCKADIRLAGGTFGHYSIEAQDRIMQQIYYAVRTIDYLDEEMPPMMSLVEEIEHHIQANDGMRIVAISIETRPDKIDVETLNRYNKYGVTFVELGIQSTNNRVLKKINRGHTVEDSIKAVSLCKRFGFKVLGHFMQDLPGSTPEMDLETFEYKVDGSTFTDWFDHIKIYPTLKLPHTVIEGWGSNKWDRYSEKEDGKILMDVLCQIVSELPISTRIARIFRDFPEATVKNEGLGYESKTMKSNMGQLITDRLAQDDLIPNEIRTREVKGKRVDLSRITFHLHKYYDPAGEEYFIGMYAPEHETEIECLLGLMRVRFNSETSPCEDVGNSAIIRELHVYGGWVPVNTKVEDTQQYSQHRGFGKYLLKVAEYMAYRRGFKKIVVISAPGTMNYYAKQGYHRGNKSRYMSRDLTWKLQVRNIASISMQYPTNLYTFF